MLSFKTLALTAAISSLSLLNACGGGGGSDSGTIGVPAPTPVVLTITDTVTMTTSKGVIEIGLDATHAPVTVANFKKYVADGFYSGTLFHRVIANFVIQGGGYVKSGTSLVEKTPTYAAIALESNNGLKNVRGTIAMARTSVPVSATSQFYINLVDNTSLDNTGTSQTVGYAVFGKVTVGLDVVDAIAAVAKDSSDVPVSDITITSVKLK